MSGLGRPARFAFTLVAWLFAFASGVQVYLAGLGVFEAPTAFNTHRDVGYAIGLLTLALLVLALVGRLPRSMIGATVLLMVLMALQSVFVFLRADAPYLAALHPLNGFAILAVAIGVAVASHRHLRPPPTAAG